MNVQAIQILFLKDLFLSRRQLFAYFAAGIGSSILICQPTPTLSYIGFLLIITVAIAAGIHLIAQLLLTESLEHTRLFVMSMPVSLLEYSIAKISVVLTTYLIPWSAMLVCCVMGTFLLPWAERGSVIVLPPLFLFLLAGFMVQLVTAVVTESVGWTLCMVVANNVLLNVFLVKLSALPEIIAAKKSQLVVWPSVILQIIAIECFIIVVAIAAALLLQSRKRDLV